MVVARVTEWSPVGLPKAFKDVVELGFRQALPRNGCSYIYTSSKVENLIRLHHSLSASLALLLPVAVVTSDPGGR